MCARSIASSVSVQTTERTVVVSWSGISSGFGATVCSCAVSETSSLVTHLETDRVADRDLAHARRSDLFEHLDDRAHEDAPAQEEVVISAEARE